jgi:hypothetical protein
MAEAGPGEPARQEEQGSAGGWKLLDPPTVQLGVMLYFCVVLVAAAWREHGAWRADDGPLVALILLLLAGALAGRFGQTILQHEAWSPEIGRLLRDAGWRFDARGKSALAWGSLYPPLPSGQLLLVVVGLAYLIPLWFFGRLPGTDALGWRLVAALAVSEAIYLAWIAEGLMLKAELTTIARRWARLQIMAARTWPRIAARPAEGEEAPLVAAAEAPVAPRLDLGWAERVRRLAAGLTAHGLRFAPPPPVLIPAGRSGRDEDG